MSIESEIQSEVEALRARFPETKALYREVCALLFFRYGITPTANKLYQFVQKGSMSAPADALAKFWDELRTKARIEIDHPDLPIELRDTAAAAIAGLWQQASAAARQELAAVRQEVQQQLEQVRTELAAEQRRAADLEERLQASRAEVAAAGAATSQARDELTSERHAHGATTARLETLGQQLTEAQAALDRARRDFAAELERTRQAVEAAQARADATERRAKVDMDTERQARARAERTMGQLREQLAQEQSGRREEALRTAERAARLEMARDTAMKAAEVAEHRAGDLAARVAQLTSELSNSQQAALRLQVEAQTMRDVLGKVAPTKRTSRKAIDPDA